MAGTGSNTTVAEEVFVPEHRILPVARQISLDLPTVRNAGNLYFRKPLVSFLIGQAAGAPVGTARGAFDAFMRRLPGRAITYTTYQDRSAAPVTHLDLGEAAMKNRVRGRPRAACERARQRRRRRAVARGARPRPRPRCVCDATRTRGRGRPLRSQRSVGDPGRRPDPALPARHPGAGEPCVPDRAHGTRALRTDPGRARTEHAVHLIVS